MFGEAQTDAYTSRRPHSDDGAITPEPPEEQRILNPLSRTGCGKQERAAARSQEGWYRGVHASSLRPRTPTTKERHERG